MKAAKAASSCALATAEIHHHSEGKVDRRMIHLGAFAYRHFLQTTAAAFAVGATLAIPTKAPLASPAHAQSRPAKVAGVAEPFAAFVAEAAQHFRIPASWIRAIMHAESREDARATSPKGAMGLMQIMPSTWTELRAKHRLGVDPYDPHDNILAGAAFLQELHDRYGSPGFLAAYNAGARRYEDHLATGRPLPAETQAYVAAIVPLIGEGQADDTIKAALSIRPWTEAPLFAGQDQSPQTVDQSIRPATPNIRPTERRIVDVTALAPRSDSLFVQVSEREPTR